MSSSETPIKDIYLKVEDIIIISSSLRGKKKEEQKNETYEKVNFVRKRDRVLQNFLSRNISNILWYILAKHFAPLYSVCFAKNPIKPRKRAIPSNERELVIAGNAHQRTWRID